MQFLLNRIRDIAKSQAPSATFRNMHLEHIEATRIPFVPGVPHILKGGSPTVGTISFDFVPGPMLPSNAQPMETDEWNKVITLLQFVGPHPG